MASAATQDIVIDAYRIELAETEMQTVLASTYNAGYRIGMIVAGAGALFLAAHLGTAKRKLYLRGLEDHLFNDGSSHVSRYYYNFTRS